MLENKSCPITEAKEWCKKNDISTEGIKEHIHIPYVDKDGIHINRFLKLEIGSDLYKQLKLANKGELPKHLIEIN